MNKKEELVHVDMIKHDEMKLKMNLAEAIEKEDYLSAAVIRDLLKTKPVLKIRF